MYLKQAIGMYFCSEMNKNSYDILAIACKQPVMKGSFVLLQEKAQITPGSVQYTIRRYQQNSKWSIENIGMLAYHYEKSKPRESFLELKFCISGNIYCRQKDKECDLCKYSASKNCLEKVESVDVLSFRFSPTHLSQFVKSRKGNEFFSTDILNFKYRTSFTKIIPMCFKTQRVLESLLNQEYSGSLENIFINAQTQMLLLYSLDCMLGDKEVDIVNFKFLANEADREKITKAREILIEHIGEPITIKALSRKVAINECYLKKGFKELFGTTIFDFYQSQRMEHAKYLLYEKGLSVTEVSILLGYSSISHFSTAFKKHTGLKPCELLLR